MTPRKTMFWIINYLQEKLQRDYGLVKVTKKTKSKPPKDRPMSEKKQGLDTLEFEIMEKKFQK